MVHVVKKFDYLTKLWLWLSPPVPARIRDDLQQAQFRSVRKQVPMLLSVAALNVVIIMAVCAHDGLPWYSYGWMSLLLLYCAVRLLIWSRILRRPVDKAQIPRLLRLNLVASLLIITLLSADAAVTFIIGLFKSPLLIPISLGFGATSIAHCLYTLRPAAIGTIIIGIIPTSVAMIVVGPFEAQMLGIAMISVGVLMVRFVAEQYEQLITGLLLADDNRRLALTDPLTGLANRRAIMAMLVDEIADNSKFAVALIDLDGFKQVNDNLGHHMGDQLLCEVAGRLRDAADDSDEIGRLGGDEFIAVFRNSGDERECAGRANALLGALSRPVEIEGMRLRFGASLGFAVKGLHGDTVEQLLRSADEALYAAKRTANRAGGSLRSARLAA